MQQYHDNDIIDATLILFTIQWHCTRNQHAW